MIRTCCACQKKQSSTTLIRLFIDDSGELRPTQARPFNGRSAWVCYNSKCIIVLTRKPQKTYRALRRTATTNQLQDSIYTWLSITIYKLLCQLHRSGLLSWKKNQKIHSNIQYWITLNGEFAKTQKIEYFKADEKSIPPFRISLIIHTRTDDMKVIGVQSGKTSKLLQQRIHLLDQLKPHCSRDSQTNPQ